MKIVFKSPLSIDKCIERIQEVRKSNPSSVFLYHPVLPFPGDMQDNKICLGHKSRGRNSFSPVFLGQFSTVNNNQTELSGKLVLHPFVKGFMVLWMSLAFFIASLLISSNIKASMIERSVFQVNAFDWIAFLFPISGLLIVSFGIALGQSEGKATIELLEKCLQATDIERLSSSNIFSKSNLFLVGVIAIFIVSGMALGFSSNAQHNISADAEIISFYTCSKPFENECVETSYFNEKPIEIYACGHIQTNSQSRVGIYWYHESTERPIYSAIDIWLEPGFFCEKLSVAEYASGRYTVKMYQGRDVLGQYDFAIK